MDNAEPIDDVGAYPCVGVWPSMAAARERSLVVLATGRTCWIAERRDGGIGYALHVLPSDALAVQQELARYDTEQQKRAAKRKEPRFVAHAVNRLVALFWVLLLTIVYVTELRDPSLISRFSNSASAVVQHGQWWRALTALFLHGSVAHLLGNILVGGLFCALAVKLVGNLRAWSWILLAGTLANLGDAWWHRDEPFVSLGASTATFAALGVLVGVNTRWLLSARRARNGTLRDRAALLSLAFPFAAGLALLGWFGTHGENTDVVAHFLGAGCGAVIALIFVRTPKAFEAEQLPPVDRTLN